MKTKQGQALLNDLTNAPPQTLINFGLQLREIIQREPERLGAVAFLKSIEQQESLHNGGHLDKCMEAIIKNINAQNRLVKDLLMQLFNEDKVSKVPISLVMLLQAWGEDGSMQMSSDLAVILAENDIALHTHLDQLAGVSQILGEMSDESAENIWSGKSLELRTLSTALPAVLKVYICQKTVNAVTS